ncbi:hypothetical protein J2J97_08400 [Rhizobium bangladeshense]|uniref:hypothetical protein n=1 Tax=Rhizobium bangladeshense TaxID=1138189 RepID=UPI001A981492|nr:hypothetical protein [Rhizobium bangladeshense]QSY95916.1 hypothetical protein J2J97_08400 [Rhizobium bangladeshense]
MTAHGDRGPGPDAPITIQRLEDALDRLAEAIVFMGDDGMKFLPIFRRVENELAELKRRHEEMAAILERVKRSRHRREGLPS